jgi:hypothetical protein
MTTETNLGTAYTCPGGYNTTGYSTDRWSNSEGNILAEDDVCAYTSIAYGQFYGHMIYDGVDVGSVGIGLVDIFGAPAWGNNLAWSVLPTVAEANSSTTGLTVYTYGKKYIAPKWSYFGSWDIYTHDYGFSIPDDSIITAFYGNYKGYATGDVLPLGVYFDTQRLTVEYHPPDSSQSPSSNAYSSGPMMFKSPRDLLRVLKRPLYMQRASARKVSKGVFARSVSPV